MVPIMILALVGLAHGLHVFAWVEQFAWCSSQKQITTVVGFVVTHRRQLCAELVSLRVLTVCVLTCDTVATHALCTTIKFLQVDMHESRHCLTHDCSHLDLDVGHVGARLSPSLFCI